MKKLVAISIMAAMLLSVGVAAMASATDWTFLLKASDTSNNLGSSIMQAGTKATASDGYESNDAGVSFLAGSAGLGIYRADWLDRANPALFGSDKRASLTGANAKSWDIVFFLGTGYNATNAKVVWYNTSTATVDMVPQINGQDYVYTLEVLRDPTGINAGRVITIDPNVNGTSSTNPMGSLVWNSGIDSLKMASSSAYDNGVLLRFTAAPVPEPSSIFALASGLVGMAGFAIRRRK